MSTRTLGFGLSALVLCLALSNSSSAQAGAEKRNALADKQLNNVRIEAQSIGSLFAKLSLSYDIPVGVEIALNDNELAIYHLDFKNGTLSELLTQFVTQHKQYVWEIRDGTVNVFPSENHRDPILKELLATEISKLSIKENTSAWELQNSLISAPEILKKREAYRIRPAGLNFTGLYFPQLGRDFTLDVSNVTMRWILNRVIADSPTAKCWLMKRYQKDQTFFIRIGARHEASPKSNELNPI